MSLLLIPAIDLKDGQCVRLRQGNLSDVTVFSNDPGEMAARCIAQGARRIHVVDLNGAVAGRPRNDAALKSIIKAAGDIPVQVGGGIRDLETVERMLDDGASFVVMGTAAVKNPGLLKDACAAFLGRIIVSIDAKDGKVATDGWSKLSGHEVIDLGCEVERMGAGVAEVGVGVGVGCQHRADRGDRLPTSQLAEGDGGQGADMGVGIGRGGGQGVVGGRIPGVAQDPGGVGPHMGIGIAQERHHGVERRGRGTAGGGPGGAGHLAQAPDAVQAGMNIRPRRRGRAENPHRLRTAGGEFELGALADALVRVPKQAAQLPGGQCPRLRH